MAISSHTPPLHQGPLLLLRTVSESCTQTVRLFKICRHIISASLSNHHSVPIPPAILTILCLEYFSASLAWFILSAHLHFHTWKRQTYLLSEICMVVDHPTLELQQSQAWPIIEPICPDCVNINRISFLRLSARSWKEGVVSEHYYVSDTWHIACLPQCLSITNPVYHYSCL